MAQSLPSGWATADIGSVGAAGSSSGNGSNFTVNGAGADIWDSSDAFRFTYRTLTGNGSIVAQVSTIEHVDAWTKAGVMMRDALIPTSRHASVFVTPGKGVVFQRRKQPAGISYNTLFSNAGAPYYVKVVRSGDTFTSYASRDGVSWSTIGTTTIAMGDTIYVGVAVSSHVKGNVASATFKSAAISGGGAATTPQPSQASGDPVKPTPAPAPAPAPAPIPSSGGASALRMLHWNTHHGGVGTDGRYDAGRIAAWIAKIAPDLVSLNEVDDSSQVNAIVSALKAKTGATWNAAFSGRGNLVLSRLPLQSKSNCLYDPAYGHNAAHVSVLVNGRSVNVWSTHLDVNSAKNRAAQGKAMQACAQNWSEGRIIAGDFNMQADTSEYNVMASTYVDSWRAAKSAGSASTYAGNCDGCTRNSRIDYVFMSKGASKMSVKSAAIIDTRDAKGVMPSDHKPMLVTFNVN